MTGEDRAMKFSLAIDLSRDDPAIDMREVARHTMEMVQMADAGGFEVVWAAEHHAIEMTIAPNPFQLLAWFGANSDNIRLGIAVVQAPYWHPIKVAGEVGLLDLMSGGRVEFGIGRGAYQREFDRMMGGMDQHKGVAYMQEMLPVLKALWRGDVAHQGRYWQFPSATSCPKPLQKPHPPIWVAARDPGTYAAVIKEGCSIMSWALTRPFSEVEKYKRQFESALADNPGMARPRFMTMRHTGIYEKPADVAVFIDAIVRQGRQFENLFRNLAPVVNGFPEDPDPALLAGQADYHPATLEENLILGTPEQSIEKLGRYEELGVDCFCYMASYGLPMSWQRRSLELFVNEVMPAFQDVRRVAA